MKQIQLIILLLGFNNFFWQEKPILIVDNDEVFKSEFEQIYWKNKKEKVATKEDLNEYIKLFVNFKLKVKAAEAIGLDTTKKFKDELSGYRYQLEKPYLIDTSINEDLINEAYYTVQEGTASKKDIDLGMKLGTAYPKGPFEWSQEIGLDHVYETLDALYQDTKDERYKIASLLKTEYFKEFIS